MSYQRKRIGEIFKSEYKAKPTSKALRDSLKRKIEEESLEDKLSYQKKLDKRNKAIRNYSGLPSRYRIFDGDKIDTGGNILLEGCVISLIVFGVIIAICIASC